MKTKHYIIVVTLIGFIAITAISMGNTVGKSPGWKIIRPPFDVMALAQQGEIIWAGGKEGIYAIDINSGKLLKEVMPSKQPTFVKAIFVDDKNTLWVGHFNGLNYFDGKNWKTLSEQDGLPDNRVNAIWQLSTGKMTIGTWGGVGILDGRSWQTLTVEDGIIDNMVNIIYEDNFGGIWIGSLVSPAGGLSYYDGERWRWFSIEHGLPHNNINAILQSTNGTIWVATGYYDRGGAVEFNFKNSDWVIHRVLSEEDGLAGQKVRSLYQDSRGWLWFGSEYDGCAIYNGAQWRVISPGDGLADWEVKSILEVSNGDIWLGTTSGITVINKSSIERLFETD